MNLNLRTHIKKKAEGKIRAYLEHKYVPVKVEPREGLFNYRCYNNAIEYSRTHPNTVPIMGIYLDNGIPYMHFWNKDAFGDHLEITLGYMANYLDYYPIRELSTDEYEYSHDSFCAGMDYWLRKFTSPLERLILGKDARVV